MCGGGGERGRRGGSTEEETSRYSVWKRGFFKFCKRVWNGSRTLSTSHNLFGERRVGVESCDTIGLGDLHKGEGRLTVN